MPHLLEQGRQALAPHLHGVQPGQRGQAELERCRAQVVARGARVLHHQAQTLEADQVTVGLGRAHVGGGGEVAQHQRPGGAGQHVEQRKADLDGLDAGAFLVVRSRRLVVLKA